MIDKVKRRNAVARIMAAENKTEAIAAEAKRLGTHSRTVERWIESAKAAAPPAVETAVPGNATPPGETPKNPVLDTLLQSEGGAVEPGKGPITPGEVQKALKDQEEFVLNIFNGAKSAGGSVLVGHRYSPPLDPMDPAIIKLLKFGVAAETAIRANAPRLYPILVKHISTWSALILTVGSDALATFGAIEGLAKSKGWTPKTKKEAERAARSEVPSPAAFAEQIRAAQARSESAASPQKGEETVVNAPMPTPEEIQNFNTVSKAFNGPQVPVPVN